ncbi:CP250 protein, partial [Nothocercus nigrocapillus]|nr:CP250 protein [Nothocercus nigrocapillus]
VLQYRTWCRELEQRLEAGGGSLPDRWEVTEDHSLENALSQLEEEQQRCENLAEVNTLLREHLDKANDVNIALKEDVGKLTADWMRAREELELKENEWRSEREFYDSYLKGEHNRLLSLWRQVVTFRRHFLEMKTATDRDLSELKAEQMRLSGSILVNCFQLNSGVQLWESLTLGRPVLKDQTEKQVEKEINQKTWEVMSFQVKGDLEKKELQDRVMELSALLVQSQKQNEEKEKTMKTLNDTVEILEASRLEVEYEASLTKNAKEENLSLQKLIKDIIEVVLDDGTVSNGCPDSSQYPESSSIPSCLSSDNAEYALVLVQEVLARKRRETQALKDELSAKQNSISFLQHQHRQQEEECKKLQQRLEQLEEECKLSSSQRKHLQSLVEGLRSDCASLERNREELQQQLRVTEQEAWQLRQSNTELQLKEDSAQEEKVEQQQTAEREHWDRELLQKDLAALEAKHSLLQSELIVARETLEKSQLHRDLLKQEKHELTMALKKAEQLVAELSGAQNKLRSETADLHIATAKMSSINEALALDKVQLNKLVLQLEQENEVLSSKVEEMEKTKISVQEKLNLCKMTNEELCTEKAHLEQQLKKAKDQQEGLQVKLRIMAEEKEEIKEKLNQVCHQQESASSDLEQLRQESSHQADVLSKMSGEKEVLVHEKAALEVRLAAMERDRRDLSEQLAEARSMKEILESSLFEAQHHLSQLEVTRSQLEIQLHTVTQAKEVIQGEVECLHCELEAERSQMKQERESMAQQLLRTEQQCNDTLRLQQTDHEVEINKLLQDLASEQEGHHSELREMLERWDKEKAEAEGKHEKQLMDMRQKVAAMQVQQDEERNRAETAKKEVLLEKENEKKALLETLLQTQGELTEACKQLEQLRQDVKEQQENGQNVTEKLQAELQEAQSKAVAMENRHKEEIKTLKEEMNVLLQQRDALQKKVEDLKSQLAISEESRQIIGREAEEHLREAQELSRQKMLECSDVLSFRLTLSLEKKELTLRTLEENSVSQQNEVSKLLSAIREAQQLHSDHRREIQELNNQVQSLQEMLLEKEAGLVTREKQLLEDLEQSRAGERCLRDSLRVLEAEMSELQLRLCSTENRAKALAAECQQANGARHEAQAQLHQLHLVLRRMLCGSAETKRDLLETEWLLSSEQDHAWGLTVSQAGDLPVDITVDRVAATLRDLHQDLKHTQQDLNDTRKKSQELERELNKRLAERDHFSARNLELQELLAQSQEGKKNSLQAALQEEAAALKKEVVTLHQEVASLERRLESTEKQRKEVLHERDTLQAVKEEMVWEIKLLQESVTASETRANAATNMKHSLEEELQSTLSVLKIKKEEVAAQQEKIQMLQKEVAEMKALQENLIDLTAILSKKEGEIELHEEKIRMLENQNKMHQSTLDDIIKDKTEKKQKIESQQEQIRALEKQHKMQTITISKLGKDLEERDQEIRTQQEQIEELQKQQEIQRSALSKTSKDMEERDREIRSQQEQIQELEKERERQRSALSNTRKDLEEKGEEIRSQQEKIQELEKQQERQSITVGKMRKDLKEKDQEIRTQQEQIHELEKEQEIQHMSIGKMRKHLEDRNQEIRSQQEQIQELEEQQEQCEMQRSALSKISKDLEERDQEIKFQERKMMAVEERGASQVSCLLEELDHMKINLKEKSLELISQAQQAHELEMKREEVKSLHADLEHLRAILGNREDEAESQRDQLRFFQQYKEQQDGYLQELHGKLEKVTLSLSEREQELELQRKEIQESEKAMETKLKTVHDQLEQTLETLKEKDRHLDMQKQEARKYEEKTEKQMEVLHRDLEHCRAILREREFMIESQKELIETFQKQERDSEQQREILKHLKVAVKEQEQENKSLKKQCEEYKEKEEKHKAEQADLRETEATLKERERKIELLEEAISKLQQQKEETAMQTKTLLHKLEYAESSLTAREQEIVSLQKHVQELLEQKELDGKQAKDLQQGINKMSQTVKSNCLEFLDQTKQINMYQLREESMKVALTSCQKQVNLLEEMVKRRDEDNETLTQKLWHKEEELKTLQNLQVMLTEEKEENRYPRELLEEVLHEGEQNTKTQGEQKQLGEEEEMRGLQEDLQHVQHTLVKKDEEIKYQRERVRHLEKNHFLKRQNELAQQLEDERKVKGKELERVIAVLKQTESGEIEWKEKAQALTLALTKSEMANGSLREEIAILRSMVSERDKDRFHFQAGHSPSFVVSNPSNVSMAPAHLIFSLYTQQAIAEGEQLSWLSEKRLMQQRLESLQQAVARLEHEKTELKQLNTELRRTLEQVERERRRLKRGYSGQSLPDACRFSLSESERDKMPASKQEEVRALCRRLAELQKQVSLLQRQLAQERKYKQDYVECCTKTSQELLDLHEELSYSLAAVVREPRAAVLEAETQKLDRSLNRNLALTPVDHQSPERQPLHSTARRAGC